MPKALRGTIKAIAKRLFGCAPKATPFADCVDRIGKAVRRPLVVYAEPAPAVRPAIRGGFAFVRVVVEDAPRIGLSVLSRQAFAGPAALSPTSCEFW